MIVLERVTKRFGSVVAVDDVSLTVARGGTHVLLGTSGCGKSTILRLILGVLTPDGGTIRIDGKPVGGSPRDARAREIGYVVQEGALYPHLTARRNVTLPAEVQGWPRARIAERLRGLARMVGLDEATLEQHPRELSGGQRQRVGLIRALMLDPPILLLDEPLAALDPIVRADLQTELRRIFADLGKTVVLVTHDIREAVLFGTTITLMTQGRIVQQGTFAELARRPAEPFVAEFIGAQAPPDAMRRYLP